MCLVKIKKMKVQNKINLLKLFQIVFLIICFSISLFFIPSIREILIEVAESVFNRDLNHVHWHTKILYVVIGLFSFFCSTALWLILSNNNYFNSLNTNKKQIIIVCGIIVFSSLVLLLPGVYEGHDLTFHLLRIEGIANALKNGSFPVRLQSIWLDGYGYPVSIYYGDILLYFPAVLHIAGIPLILSYKIFVLMINILTILISYIAFTAIFKNIKIASLLSLLYSTAPYRFVDIYIRCAVGEFTAFLFFPIIALAFYTLYSGDLNKQKQIKSCIFLSLGMSGLILTHILSTEIIVVLLFVVCLVLWNKTFTKQVLIPILFAIILTIFICAGFIIPFIDYYINVPVNINNVENKHIQNSGVYFIQLFYFFQNPYGTNSTILKERMLLSPGLPIISGIIISMVYILKKKKDKELLFLLILTLLTIFLSTNIFPWDLISNNKIGSIFTQIQFPWRWLGIVMILSILLIGRMLIIFDTEKDNNNIFSNNFSFILIILVFVQVFSMNLQYSIGYSQYSVHNYEEIGSDKIGGAEYIRLGTDFKNRNKKINIKNVNVSNIKRIENEFKIHISSSEEGFIELPLYNYKGYKAIASNGQELEIIDGINNLVKIIIPKDFNSDVVVKFKEPKSWRISELVSFVTTLFIIIFYYINKRRTNI